MNELSFADLLDRVTRTARDDRQPVQAMIELTYGCNLRCVHCYNPTHEAKDELSTDAVVRILYQLAAEGCLRVGFTGGELFCRRDALEIMEHARRVGLIVNVLTNATMITPAAADRLQALAPYEVDVSMYGASAPTYEQVTGVPGSFARFLAGLDLLVERRLPLLLKLVLLTVNFHERGAMQAFAARRGLRYQFATDVHPRVDGSPDPLAYRLSPDQAFEVWRSCLTDEPPPGVEPSAPHAECRSAGAVPGGSCGGDEGALFQCRCGRTSAAITPHGALNLCLSIYYPQYDLARGSVAEGWRALVDVVRSARPGPDFECRRCAVESHCTRGVGDSWLATGAFDAACLPYFREAAERRRAFLEEKPRPAAGSACGDG